MKKILFIIVVLLIALMPCPAQSDDVKQSAFTTGTTMADTDYLTYLYVNGGQYYNRKITVANAKTVFGGGSSMTYPSAGIAVSTGSAWDTAAGYANIVALFNTGSCTGYLKSDGTCDTGAGGGTVDVSGTPTNHQWPGWVDADTLKGFTVTASKPVCSDASGDPAVCSGTEGVWQTAITFGTGVETALASAPDASGGLLSVDGLGSVTQAYSAILDGIAGVTPANNGIFGYNNSGTLGLYTNHSHDDSAAQFYDTTTTTNTVKVDAPTDTDGGIGAILDFSAVADADKTFTFPNATGTVALVTTEKLAVFNIDGTAPDNTVIDSYIPVASTITGAVITTTGAACSAVVDIKSDSYTGFPGTLASIVASAKPTLSTAQKGKPDVATWTKPIAADTVLRANLDSSDCAGVIQVTLYGTK
jgi:hypothetical protein